MRRSLPYSAAFHLITLAKVLRMASNARVLIGGQRHAVDGETARGRRRPGNAARVVMNARPRPILWTARQPRLHRVHVNMLHLLVVLLHRAQGTIKEARLPQQARFPVTPPIFVIE